MLCDGVSTTCPTMCVGDNDCESSHYCTGGNCLPKGLNGASCGGGNECVSGDCVDTRCCDSACNGVCESCNIGGWQGSCTPFTDGSDPESECGSDLCNGTSACRCNDGQKNYSETDVDCGGGGACSPCGNGLMCTLPADCSSGVCTLFTCQAPLCGDGVVNGTEVCDFMDPLTPCCATTCMGPSMVGVGCGSDPDGLGCQAVPACDGLGSGVVSCLAQSEPDTTPCTDDGQYCNGSEQCSSGLCVPTAVDPCPGPDSDDDCNESCDELNDTCLLYDGDGAACNDGMGHTICGSGTCSLP